VSIFIEDLSRGGWPRQKLGVETQGGRGPPKVVEDGAEKRFQASPLRWRKIAGQMEIRELV
jgi:hypothetical protein